MSAPERPTRGKPPLSIRDEVAPGAVHERRDAMSERTTGLRASRPKIPSLRDYEEESTILGLAPPPRDEMDSRDISIETLLEDHKREADARRKAERELAELRARPRVEVASIDTSAVHIRYGKLKLALPVVLLAGLASGGTYVAVRNTDSARPPSDDVLTEVRALKAAVDKRNNDQDLRDGFILQRVGTLETQNGVTQAQLAAILAQLRNAR